ncbi:MAG: Mur ligase family protein [bacterium]|nr:Mur ligase family protein [bacterium]
MEKISNYKEAIDYLYSYIPHGLKYKFPGDLGLRRTKYLLILLGEPQNKLRVIHVAGTSGKGSTCHLIYNILQSQGFKVGFHVSPHLNDLRERFQINNTLIPIEEFCQYLNEVIPFVEKMKDTEFGLPTYFEMIVAFAYYVFYKKRVEYVVMETGLGGLYDATNVVDREDKIAVITRIGHDHTEILGKTLDKIAFQKAGIIYSRNTVITIQQSPKVLKVIQTEANKKQAKFYIIRPKNISHTTLIPQPQFDFHFFDYTLSGIKLGLLGSFQIENASLALGVILLLSRKDNFTVDVDRLKHSLRTSLFPGRMQIVKSKGQTIVIDGAHNPQKMKMFIQNLKIYFPDQKYTFLIAFKRGKDYKPMLKYILPEAKKIIITSFFNESQGLRILAEDPLVIAKILEKLHFKNYIIIPDTFSALEELYKDTSPIKVITGSLYLIGEVYSKLRHSGKE